MNYGPKVVFLDRASITANIRTPAFKHHWIEHDNTTIDQVVERSCDATFIITNKVPLSAKILAQLPHLEMIAVAGTGTNLIDVEFCRQRGIPVVNVGDYAMTSVPEH